MRRMVIVWGLLALACGSRQPPSGEGGPPPDDGFAQPPPGAAAPDAAVASADASVATGPCHADAQHCCQPGGSLVRPGGCQPSYPDDVQPATERGADGMCVPVECHLKCLPETARIATPRGDVLVTDLAAGDTVWTLDRDGRRVEAPVYVRTSVPAGASHTMVVLDLADGRTARASAGHPTVTGRTLGALSPGDALDGAAITRVRIEPYAGARTWDLLPGGPTGVYWADGVLMRSTLTR